MQSRQAGGSAGLGDLVAGFGAVLLLYSLWQPWYRLRFPPEVIAQARQFAGQTGDLAVAANQGLDQLQAQGSIGVSAWRAFEGADAAMTACSVAVLVIVSLKLMGGQSVPAQMSRMVGVVGAIAFTVATKHLVDLPGDDSVAGTFLKPATGTYVGIAGAAVIIAGGIVELTRANRPPPPATPPPEHLDVNVWPAS